MPRDDQPRSDNRNEAAREYSIREVLFHVEESLSMGTVKYFDELWVDKAVISMDTARSYFTASKHRVECVGGPVIRWRQRGHRG